MSSTESFECIYLEEYNKYNKITLWFILLYILRSFISFCYALQISFFEMPESVNYFQRISSFTEIKFLSYRADCCYHNHTVQHRLLTNVASCEKENLINVMALYKNFGFVLGSLFTGILADIFGRRITSIYISCIWFISALIMIFITSFTAFQVCFVAISICCSSIQIVTFVNFAEICHKKYRILSIYTLPSFILGCTILYAATLMMERWIHLMVFNAFLIPYVVFASWYIPESPRWLLNKNKRKKAYDQLSDISGRSYNVSTSNESLDRWIAYRYMMRYLCTAKLKHFIVFIVVISAAAFYYSVGKWQAVKLFVHTNHLGFLIYITEAVSYLFIVPLYFFLGKRYGLLFLFALMVAGTLITLFTYDENTMKHFNVFAILLGLSSMHLIWLYILDVFPTFIRATIVSFCFSWYCLVRICGIFFIDRAHNFSDFYYYLTFLFIGVVGLVMKLLPVVSNSDLPNYRN